MLRITHAEGAVLAGGLSSRMGRDKASIRWQGRSLAARISQTLGLVVSPVRLILHDQREVPPDVSAPVVRDVELFSNQLAGSDPVRAPILGVAAALADASAPWVLVAACDLPCITPEVLLCLLSLAGTESEAEVIVPEGPDGLEPLLALYHRRQLTALLDRIRSRRLGLRDWIQSRPAIRVPFRDLEQIDPNLTCFLNLNRPSDLEALEARGIGTHGG